MSTPASDEFDEVREAVSRYLHEYMVSHWCTMFRELELPGEIPAWACRAEREEQ